MDPFKLFLIGNKKDLGPFTPKKRIENLLKQLKIDQKLQGFGDLLKDKIHIVSAFDKTDGEFLKGLLVQSLGDSQYEDQAVISQARHYENLQKALQNMDEAYGLVKSAASPELTALSMKEALLMVQETLGKRFDDQIMDRVFKEFCIGK